MTRPRTRLELIAQAIKEAGTTATGPVMLKLEDILHREMLSWPSYEKAGPKSRMGALIDRLDRMEIYTYSDVRRLIAEVRAVRAGRQEEFLQALGMDSESRAR